MFIGSMIGGSFGHLDTPVHSKEMHAKADEMRREVRKKEIENAKTEMQKIWNKASSK